MAQDSFTFYNIEFKRRGDGRLVFATGEISNCSNKGYATAVFRICVFDKNMILWTGNIKIRNFRNRQTRSFDFLMEGLSYNLVSRISRYDIYFESGY